MKNDRKKSVTTESLTDLKNPETEITKGTNNLSGYPVYPAKDDIYNKDIEEEINPEDVSKIKMRDAKPGKRNEKEFDEDLTGDDLDIPGSESDDEMEIIGSEDEENNYYSLGDDRQDRDEDKSS